MVFNTARAFFARNEEPLRPPQPPQNVAPQLSPSIMAMKPKPKSMRRLKLLQDPDIQFFMTYGYLKVPACFTRVQCEHLMGDLWQRMGVSPDKSTWTQERFDVPGRHDFSLRTFAPRAWAAICDLLGGEERLEDGSDYWDDSFIVNLGTKEGEGKHIEPGGWHVDGDFFAHYLDSPEQALLVLPLFTDVRPGGGATALCPDALPEIARFLLEHPEGVSPDLVPRSEDPYWNREPRRWRVGEIADRLGSRSVVEATGNAGDVYFLHPLMVHSWSHNMYRDLRVINNPNVTLKQPFKFDRWSASDYSIVELTTLNILGAERLKGWKVTGTRDFITKEQRRWQREEEEKRLNEMKPVR